jgi:hypothetical protein
MIDVIYDAGAAITMFPLVQQSIFPLEGKSGDRAAEPLTIAVWRAFVSCSATGHHQAGLGMLMPKVPAGAVLKPAFALKSRFCHSELLWFRKWNFLTL